MGRFLIAGFQACQMDFIVKTLAPFTVIHNREERDDNDGGLYLALLFNETKFGKVLVEMLPDRETVFVRISSDVKNPSLNSSHTFVLSDCKKIHLHRVDVSGIIGIAFEDKHGNYLKINQDGQVYFGKINWKELGDTFKPSRRRRLPTVKWTPFF